MSCIKIIFDLWQMYTFAPLLISLGHKRGFEINRNLLLSITFLVVQIT